jgi:hypothetical protein
MIVKNVITNGQITNDVLYKQLLSLISDIQLSNDHLKANYTVDSLDLNGHKSFDVLLAENCDIICFSGLYHRNTWPDGFYRISNRTYVVPKYRTTTYNFFNPFFIGPFQIAKYHADIKTAFISRELPKSRFYFKRLQKSVPYYNNWKVSNNMVQLSNSNQPTSFQYIIHNGSVEDINQFNSITEDEWKFLKD